MASNHNICACFKTQYSSWLHNHLLGGIKITMSSKTELLQHQRNWAEAKGLKPDNRGYLSDIASNLLRPMTAKTKSDFERGSGSELQDTPTRPAKMKALHSSSALAVNFFDSWLNQDKSALQKALKIDKEISAVSFEEQFPTGLTGNPPNLDVVLVLTGGSTIGIESKFSEWLAPKSENKVPFKLKYFPPGPGIWSDRGLPASQELANQMHRGVIQFRYLDAPQLLKHALGLATQLGDQFSLYYTYLDWPGKESKVHREEVNRFTELVGDELRFKAVTYQQLLLSLQNEPGVDPNYLSYLGERYCCNAA